MILKFIVLHRSLPYHIFAGETCDRAVTEMTYNVFSGTLNPILTHPVTVRKGGGNNVEILKEGQWLVTHQVGQHATPWAYLQEAGLKDSESSVTTDAPGSYRYSI